MTFHGLYDWITIGIPAVAFVFTMVVFFHELGHFLVARACGVAIETFSIGFGGEIYGWTDKKATRWKICWLPLGGYVKFKGDENAASVPDMERIARMTPEERVGAFPLKPLWQRMLVVLAGPAANFVLAFVILTFLFAGFGARGLGTYVGSVTKGSPAAEAGIKTGDKVVAVNGKGVLQFTPDLTDAIANSKSAKIVLSIVRNGQARTVSLTKRMVRYSGDDGKTLQKVGIGIGLDLTNPENLVEIPVPLTQAPLLAVSKCWGIVDASLTMVWRIVSHKADGRQLGGPIGIAQMAKSAASHSFYELISLVAFISVSIGLINLFPIPLLDGGHLLYYACEGVLGRPLSERVQDVGFRLGLALVIGLFVFATWNDLVR